MGAVAFGVGFDAGFAVAFGVALGVRFAIGVGLGFCGFGEAKDWLDGGKRIAADGELPVNPHGGQLSEGRTHGFGFIHEAVAQLRHEAGDRQVPGARTAVVTTGGGTPSGVMLLRRDGA